MIQQQTFELNKEAKAELLMLCAVLDLIGKKHYAEAAAVLIGRQDELTKESTLKLYNPRAA